MPSSAAFIGVDWGTSNARFLLVAHDGSLIDTRSGPGIGQLDGADAIENVCFEVIGAWIDSDPTLPVIMAGMVGSNIGWHMAGYSETPATLNDVAARLLSFRARSIDFSIAPGLSTIRGDGLPDVMRGEEVQIFGGITGEDALVCLPGTHSKWAQVSKGSVTAFHTAPIGELLDIIGRHSILLHPRRPVVAMPDAAFVEGVEAVRSSNAGFESLLFTVRSRQIAHTLKPEAADSYLAGLAIGCEIKSALALYDGAQGAITLIGAPKLTALYATALPYFDATAQQIDGDAASLSGITKLYQARR